VVHVDDTARPQVISSEDDPLYYAIVRGFYEKTGIGCVVNTSFNLHEEPIVNTPAEALKSFADGAVDLLIMENYIVRRP
jgi:carbamoyltransferase